MDKGYYTNQIVWIIGASSGIGLSLARELAQRGATLILSARSKESLEALESTLEKRHKVLPLDVRNADETLSAAQTIRDTFGRIDRVIYLAGAYVPMMMDNMPLTAVKEILDTNLMGAFNLVHAILPILKNQGFKSQLALCASVAGYIGLPGGQPYSATKAGLINLAESLYSECKNYSDIKLINPGFVRTPLTEKNTFEMPFIIDASLAAQKIANGLLTSSFEIHFPQKMSFLLKVVRLLPYMLSLRLTEHLKK